ncbi:hypothetical protein [Bradyrhizobium oligotrophicum]|uniref:hypothetical protein n=1 Tax=Bradyrhizobium oligotrophicum TaxID=44255 RepID=UPI0011818E65|nr:hypothetical protein [Bradyrhizobium oligotrophicum]
MKCIDRDVANASQELLGLCRRRKEAYSLLQVRYRGAFKALHVAENVRGSLINERIRLIRKRLHEIGSDTSNAQIKACADEGYDTDRPPNRRSRNSEGRKTAYDRNRRRRDESRFPSPSKKLSREPTRLLVLGNAIKNREQRTGSEAGQFH